MRDATRSVEGLNLLGTISTMSSVTAQRGYDDLDPERAWEQWQSVRTQLEE